MSLLAARETEHGSTWLEGKKQGAPATFDYSGRACNLFRPGRATSHSAGCRCKVQVQVRGA
eukprot:7598831-Karenia_brevis.AAC.1